MEYYFSFKLAEVDSTIALQLDNTYVKAYQRRAFARKALKQYQESISDYEEVLNLEPKNSLARFEIDKINEYLTKVDSGVKPVFDPKKLFSSAAPKEKSVTKVQNEPKKEGSSVVPSTKTESKST